MRKHCGLGIVQSMLLAILFLTGCEDRVPQYRESAATATSATASTAPVASAPADRLRGRKRGRRGIAPFYVDGELRGVLRYGELPPGFEPTVVDRRGDSTICNMSRFLKAHGVDLAKVSALHLHGSGRIAEITGDELRKHEDTLHFAFTKYRGTFGNARVDWPAEKKLTANTRIDKIAAIQVFENKPAPIWDADKRKFHWADGSKVEGMAYVGERPKIKSARLYLDGKLIGFVDDVDKLPATVMHRVGGGRGTGKTTPSLSVEGEEDDDDEKGKGGRGGGKKVLLAKYLEHRGVDLGAIQTVEIIGEDRVLGRFSHDLWAQYAEGLTFGVPRRNAKKLKLSLEEPVTPYPGPVLAQAIAVYVKVKPSEREVALPRWRPRRQ